jgi:cytochrome c oxidase subunit 3
MEARGNSRGMMVDNVPSVTETTDRQKELNSLSIFTVIVMLATVTMTFGALITVFVMRSENAHLWRPIQIPGVLWATTAILLTSSMTFEAAKRRLTRNDQRGFFRLMAWTTGLGVLFLIGQVLAGLQILHSGVILAHNAHSWFIFLFTGLHGLHIVAGLAGLVYLLSRTWQPASGPKYRLHTQAIATGVAVFWHYLDFVWFLLFALLLFWRR